jgi:hypothetical protein
MFPETILQINNGATVTELSEALQQVVGAVRAAGKNGSITLTVKVSPASKGSANVLMVESQVRTKLPEPERGMTIFFATEDNKLVRNDPKQQMLPLRVVEIGAQPKELKEGVNRG